jgi:hypothetical protein
MTYGDETAQRLSEENAVITMAALAGNLDALKVLLSLTAQTAYVDGIRATAATIGVRL